MNEVEEKQKVNERIVSFLRKNTNLTLATSAGNVPYCANCFYAYEDEQNLLIFKSSQDTKHIRQALENKLVAGSILPDELETAKVQGIQFQGSFLNPQNGQLESLKRCYYKKFPFALAFSGSIWAVELTHIKMTDNALGFGKKIEWSERTPSPNK